MKLGTLIRRSRKWNNYPILFLPITRGPLLGFYHFLFGYFAPVYQQLLKSNDSDFVMIDCGPMNKWFEVLPRQPSRIVDAVEALQTGYRARSSGFARRYRVKTFLDWDVFKKFEARPLPEVAKDIRRRFQPVSPETPRDKPSVVLFSRTHSPDSLREHKSRKFGSAKRDIPNLDAVAEQLKEHFSVEVVDGSAMSPVTVIQNCLRANVLIGQHGAGLANALFASPGATVFEIGWWGKNHAGHARHYQYLCQRLGLPWHLLNLQETQTSPIDANDLVQAIRCETEASESRP